MNLLLFVTALLMALASLSYSALQSYRTDALLRLQWNHYMQVERVCAFNTAVEQKFADLNDAENGNGNDETNEEINKNTYEGTSGISFYYIVLQEFVDQYPDQAKLMETITQNLIQFLYGDQDFYRKIIAERPDAVKEMLEQVRAVNSEKKKPIKRKESIVRIDPKDPLLKKLWYQILKKNPMSKSVLEVLKQKPAQEIIIDESCKISFFEYLSAKRIPTLRVYLIPRGLMYAILQDRRAVAEVVQKRNEINSEVQKEGNLEELTHEFESFSMQFSGMGEFAPVLKFDVSTTNPNYAGKL